MGPLCTARVKCLLFLGVLEEAVLLAVLQTPVLSSVIMVASKKNKRHIDISLCFNYWQSQIHNSPGFTRGSILETSQQISFQRHNRCNHKLTCEQERGIPQHIRDVSGRSHQAPVSDSEEVTPTTRKRLWGR